MASSSNTVARSPLTIVAQAAQSSPSFCQQLTARTRLPRNLHRPSRRKPHEIPPAPAHLSLPCCRLFLPAPWRRCRHQTFLWPDNVRRRTLLPANRPGASRGPRKLPLGFGPFAVVLEAVCRRPRFHAAFAGVLVLFRFVTQIRRCQPGVRRFAVSPGPCLLSFRPGFAASLRFRWQGPPRPQPRFRPACPLVVRSLRLLQPSLAICPLRLSQVRFGLLPSGSHPTFRHHCFVRGNVAE